MHSPRSTPTRSRACSRRRPQRIGRLILMGVVAAFAAACSSTATTTGSPTTDATATSMPNGTRAAIDGVVEFDVPGARHVQGEVDYSQTPPVGGDHAPKWQNCGAYAEPVTKEAAVHSLEHGAVWITYQPDLEPDMVDTLRDLAGRSDYVLLSPWTDGLPAPVVASAWGAQLQLDSPADPRLVDFLTAYVQALSAPEPGAPCSGGVSAPA